MEIHKLWAIKTVFQKSGKIAINYSTSSIIQTGRTENTFQVFGYAESPDNRGSIFGNFMQLVMHNLIT